jgi:hypothetical protein
VDLKSAVTVKMADAVISIRVLHVDELPERKPALTLEADADGLANHAVRWKLAHLSAGQQTQSKHLRLALLVAARDGADVRAAKVSSEIRDKVWSMQAALPGLSLELARSTDDRKKVESQLVNGRAVPREILSVNGKDLTAAIRF